MEAVTDLFASRGGQHGFGDWRWGASLKEWELWDLWEVWEKWGLRLEVRGQDERLADFFDAFLFLKIHFGNY